MIHIQKGVRVMFLNNTLYENGIYNGSIGIIMISMTYNNIIIVLSNEILFLFIEKN